MTDIPGPLFRVVFANEDKLFEVYARSVGQSGLFGFIEIEELVFGEHSGMLVDPAEEKLKSEFKGVKRTYVPMHSVIRIDEVEERGEAKVREMDTSAGNVRSFPVYKPGSGPSGGQAPAGK
jgi:hypothetical protein